MAAPSSERPTVLITEPIGASGMRILEQACTCIAPWRDGVHDEASLRAGLRRRTTDGLVDPAVLNQRSDAIE